MIPSSPETAPCQRARLYGEGYQQAARAFCGPARCKIAATLWRRGFASMSEFSRPADFKRSFEARLTQAAPQSGRILLDPDCRNAYKVASEKEG
jgi:hypothetical protein